MNLHDPSFSLQGPNDGDPLREVVSRNIFEYLGLSDEPKEDLPVDRASLPIQVRGPPLPLHLLPQTLST